MDILLDTHIAIWALAGSPKLPSRAFELIRDSGNRLFVSDVSLWEVAMKHMARPEGMPLSAEAFLSRCREAGYLVLPLTSEAILVSESLDVSEARTTHKDPFDRMLIAQAKTAHLLFLTHDKLLSLYHEPLVAIV